MNDDNRLTMRVLIAHYHLGDPTEAGEIISASQSQAEWLISHGMAETLQPITQEENHE